MFDHVSIGVRDLARAKRFYDAGLRPLGYVCLSENADALGYGRDKIGLWIGTAARPVPSDPASNLHFCFTAPTREAVDAFHVCICWRRGMWGCQSPGTARSARRNGNNRCTPIFPAQWPFGERLRGRLSPISACGT